MQCDYCDLEEPEQERIASALEEMNEPLPGDTFAIMPHKIFTSLRSERLGPLLTFDKMRLEQGMF